MPDCREPILSNDYADFIVGPYQPMIDGAEHLCTQEINQTYFILYPHRDRIPPLSFSFFRYPTIPVCYGLMDIQSLEASNIIRVRNQPNLSLRGRNVMIGFIDTGIDIRNPVFLNSDNTTRVLGLWDQSDQEGTPPPGFSYGSAYTKEMLDQLLASDIPDEELPGRDAIGHGTFLASVAAGGVDLEHEFSGAAPDAAIGVVKLKEAKDYLREFYFINPEAPCYQENDIMAAAAYLDDLAEREHLPLVLCIALGSNMGDHVGDTPLGFCLRELNEKRMRSVVVCAGNEANQRHHFMGDLSNGLEYNDVEIRVGPDTYGFTLELWAKWPDLYSASITSPAGETIPRVPLRDGVDEVFTFVFEQTKIYFDYKVAGVRTGSELVVMRFEAPTPGIWRIRVHRNTVIYGKYNMWLPIRDFIRGEAYFLASSPDITLTEPSCVQDLITVGAYDAATGAAYTDSGRGYTSSDEIKPDFAAPGVSVYGSTGRGRYASRTGTSLAAAVTAGAVAMLFEWAFVEQHYETMDSARTKSALIIGANRQRGTQYPNPVTGYGTLDLYAALENFEIM